MEQKLLGRLRAEHELCMAYENPKAQIEARKAVPLDKLKKAAKEKNPPTDQTAHQFVLNKMHPQQIGYCHQTTKNLRF